MTDLGGQLALSDQLALAGFLGGFALGVGFGIVPVKYLEFIPESYRLGIAIGAFGIAGVCLLYFFYDVGRMSSHSRFVFYVLLAIVAAAIGILVFHDKALIVRLICGALAGAAVCGFAPTLYPATRGTDSSPQNQPSGPLPQAPQLTPTLSSPLNGQAVTDQKTQNAAQSQQLQTPQTPQTSFIHNRPGASIEDTEVGCNLTQSNPSTFLDNEGTLKGVDLSRNSTTGTPAPGCNSPSPHTSSQDAKKTKK